MKTVLVSIENVSKSFLRNSKKHLILNQVSLEIYQGECLGIIGPSGSGKSTLCSIIQGLTPPSSGALSYYVSQYKKNYSIQTIFQDTDSSLNPRMTIQNSLEEPLLLLKKNKSTFKQKIEEILDFVGLSLQILSRFPYQISGGQKQRVVIARALLAQPDLIICDEPTSSLDPVNQQKILNLFEKTKQQFNKTFLFVSHDILAVQQLADRIAVMEKGAIIEISSKYGLLNSPKEKLTKELIFSSQALDNPVSTSLLQTIENYR